ncbi:MAG: hypothetical protein WCT31_05100 [Candidatus Micrarchaeia archaeon]
METKKILLALLAVEILLMVAFYFPQCGSPCADYDFTFLNPFGWHPDRMYDSPCIEMCVYRPFPYFYLVADIFVITLAVAAYLQLKFALKSSNLS